MSFRANIVASYASQIYVTLIGIVMMPTYLQFLGPEAFGLVGFFTVLQGWFQLLDFGLTPTLSREAARFNGGAIDGLALRRLLRVLEAVFALVAIVGSACLALGADWVGTRWLQAQQLPADQLRHAIELMGAVIGVRWMSSLYRSALTGFELQVWLAKLNVAAATARFVGIVPIFIFVGTTPVLFFAYQLLVAVLEALALVRRTYGRLPATPAGNAVGFDLSPVRGVLKFSLSVAFTGAVWVAVTQTDKLLLSRLLPLSEYAYFTFAVLVAGGITLISGPLSMALLPRLSRLEALSQQVELITLYRAATQWTTVIIAPLTLVLVCGAEPLLHAWTGDAALAKQAAPILQLYGLGNGILAVSAFPYYLQFAKGDLRLHLLGNAMLFVVLVPAIWTAARHWGGIGAGCVWLGANIAYALFWVPLVHRRFAPGLHLQWLLRDVGAIAWPVALVAALLTAWAPWPDSRIGAAALLLGSALLMVAISASASSHVRGYILARRPVLQKLTR